MALGAQVTGKLIPLAAGAAGAAVAAAKPAEAGPRPAPAELPPAAVDALFDARRSGT
jgi:hypothetical protein